MCTRTLFTEECISGPCSGRILVLKVCEEQFGSSKQVPQSLKSLGSGPGFGGAAMSETGSVPVPLGLALSFEC